MKNRWQYFTDDELSCKGTDCCGGQMKMNDHFMHKVVGMRTIMGVPFKVNSAYRCPEHNNKVSSTGLNGPHTTGRAIDISIVGMSEPHQIQLLEEAIRHNCRGIGVAKTFVHIDNLSARLWTY